MMRKRHKDKMTLKNICLLVVLSLGFYSCEKFYNKDYHTPLNTIESIKTESNTYGSIVLTIEKYLAWDQELLAGFNYQSKRASVKLNFELDESKLEFVNIGEESDYFLYAISTLFDETNSNSTMKDTVTFSIGKKGDNPKIDLFDKGNEYTLFYKPNANEKGSVRLRMTIDMELGTINIWEKNGGVAKRNFIKAFEKRNL